jgi:hypothetical protein
MGPGQQLLKVAQLSLLLLEVLLLLLPLLLQGCDLSLIAADGVCGEGSQVLGALPLLSAAAAQQIAWRAGRWPWASPQQLRDTSDPWAFTG